MKTLLSPLLTLGMICTIGCGSGSDAETESLSGTFTSADAASESSAQGSESSVSVSASVSASASSTESSGTDGTDGTGGTETTESSNTGVSASSEGSTTTSGESTVSGSSTTEGEGSTTEGEGTTTGGEGTTTGGEGTTGGGSTGGETGDVPDFVADCDDDPDNPVIVTVGDAVARFPSITSGLASSSDGALIEVCPGTYNDKIEVTIDITLRGAGSDKTIIDGGGFHFNIGAGAAVVEHFGFTHSNAKIPSGWNISSSGAISMNDTYGQQESLTVRSCRFFENTAEYGAGLHIAGSNNGGKNPDVYVENCVFEDNVAMREGGAIASYGRVHITDSSFTENEARTGGAIALSYGCTSPNTCDIENTVIKKNHTTGTSKYEGGGGIFIDSCGGDCLGGLTVTNSDLGFGGNEENTDYQDLPEDVLINDGGDPWNRYGWYHNGTTFTCSNGSCMMP